MATEDGGYASRKLVYAASTSVLIMICGIIAAAWGKFGPFLDALITGLLGALSLYLGGNLVHKHISSKGDATETEEQDANPSTSDLEPRVAQLETTVADLAKKLP